MILEVMHLRKDDSVVIRLELEALNRIFNNLRNHRIVNTNEILPFVTSTSNPQIRGRIYRVFGDYVRNICGLNMKSQKKNELGYIDEICDLISSDIDFDTTEDKNEFVRFIKSYLFENNTFRPIHPYLYNYVTSETYQGEMSKYGQFLYDVFINSDNEIKRIFSNKKTDDLLTEIILSRMDSVELLKEARKHEYQNLMPVIGKLYREDVLYLSNHKSYFLSSFPLLTHFYLFMYTCQLILKFEQFTKADFNKLDLFYFALDWESVSGRREAASGPGSFRVIKERAENLFSHVHAMSHLSHNTLNQKNGEKYKFMTYPELYENAVDKSVEAERAFIKSINQWIIDYSQLEWLNNEVTANSESKSLEEAFRSLYNALKQGMSKTARERYGSHVEHLGENQFIKRRGSSGTVFNITNEFIILLTAVSVKGERIPLSRLFNEFERRGITFDWRSKKEIVQFLDKSNFIDKKSDSGDAQYVKPIL